MAASRTSAAWTAHSPIRRTSVKYDSYGDIASGDTSITRYLFTSREYDTATGLQYSRARWYDAPTGRWIGEDPMSFSAGDANLARYVSNNPTNRIDPSGLREQQVFMSPGVPMPLIAINLANLGMSTSPSGIAMMPFGGPPQFSVPDWSNGMMVAEDPTSHEVSKFLGGQGVVTLATLGLSYVATASQAKAAIGSQKALDPYLKAGNYDIVNHSNWDQLINARWHLIKFSATNMAAPRSLRLH